MVQKKVSWQCDVCRTWNCKVEGDTSPNYCKYCGCGVPLGQGDPNNSDEDLCRIPESEARKPVGPAAGGYKCGNDTPHSIEEYKTLHHVKPDIYLSWLDKTRNLPDKSDKKSKPEDCTQPDSHVIPTPPIDEAKKLKQDFADKRISLEQYINGLDDLLNKSKIKIEDYTQLIRQLVEDGHISGERYLDILHPKVKDGKITLVGYNKESQWVVDRLCKL